MTNLRNTLSYSESKFTLSPVVDFDVITGDSFTSGDQDIDEFFHNDAKRHLADHMAVTYKLTIRGNKDILALASLQNDSIRLSEKDRLELGYPYKFTPAVKIGRLGVHTTYQCGGVGSILLNIIRKFMCINNRTGCRFLTLDAYNKTYIINFYKKNGFLFSREPSPQQKTVSMYSDLMQ